MKCNAWTLGLLSAGLVSLPALTHAEEKPSSVLTALSATTLSGYVDTSAQWNLGTGNANVPGYAWNNSSKADGFNLNVIELNLEKPVDAADQWGAGYKVSLLAGPDATSFGTLSPVLGSVSSAKNADFAIKQAYVSLHAPVGNGLDFKVGVWDTLIGYEVFESINNPNVTRSYGYSMEPTTHTGVQATYQVCDVLSASVAIADTYGPTINGRAFLGPTSTVEGPKAESYKTYMAAMTFTAPTNWGVLSGSTLTACVINGFNGVSLRGSDGFDETSFYVGASIATPVTGLKVGACYDYAAITTQPGPGSSSSTETSGYANAVGGYLSFQATEKLSLYGRAEYASSSSFGGVGVFGPTKVVEATVTLQYDLWKNVMTRAEFRWDHAADDSSPYGGTILGGAGTRDNAYMLMASIAYKF